MAHRSIRLIFIALVTLTVSHTLVGQACSAAQPGEAEKNKNLLFYTVQVGAFPDANEALAWYTRLAEALPPSAKQYLRIETVASLHAVRIGKSEKREDIISLFTEAQRITQRSPAIIQGYFSPQRITKIYDPSVIPPLTDETKNSSGIPPSSETEASAPKRPTNAQTTSAVRPDAQSITSGEAPEESLDATQGPPLSTRKADKIAAKTTIVPPLPKSAKMSAAVMKQMVIDKYLALQASDRTKQDSIIKRNRSFPESPSCVNANCHQKLTAGKVVHAPSREVRCLACHQQTNTKHPTEGKDFKLTASGSTLCEQCHPRLAGKKYSHPPALDGDCTECHNPHSSDNSFLLNVTAEDQGSLCAKCHNTNFLTKKFTHGPVGLGACTFCHAPHESDYKGLLKSDPQALCFECHTDIADGVKNSPDVHTPVKTEGCVSCHQPHSSDSPNLLKQRGEIFCFTCHPDIEDKYTKSRSKHAGLYLEKQCGTCHQPHYSPYPGLLNNKELDLCLTCHSEKNPVRSKSPKNIAIELKKTFVHEPAAKGECTACHDPHGSKYLKLLTGPYPDSFYAPYDKDIYDLCFTCHDKKLLTDPVTETTTSFRNGSANLHNLHATIPRKGRTCQTCHQPHASDGPKLINQKGSSFGEWQMSISFSTTTNGGTCMPGCHRKMEYNREKAVDNSVKETGFGTYHVEYESVK